MVRQVLTRGSDDEELRHEVVNVGIIAYMKEKQKLAAATEGAAAEAALANAGLIQSALNVMSSGWDSVNKSLFCEQLQDDVQVAAAAQENRDDRKASD